VKDELKKQKTEAKEERKKGSCREWCESQGRKGLTITRQARLKSAPGTQALGGRGKRRRGASIDKGARVIDAQLFHQ